MPISTVSAPRTYLKSFFERMRSTLNLVVTGTNTNNTRLDAIEAAGWVTSIRIAAGAVVEAAIGAGAVTTAKIAALAVTAAELAADAVTETKILNGAVTQDKIANSSVSTDKLVNASVLGSKTTLFISGEQTGTAAPQTIAHSLGYDPTKVFIIPTTLTAALAGGYAVTALSHDATNITVTVTTGEKFIALAF